MGTDSSVWSLGDPINTRQSILSHPSPDYGSGFDVCHQDKHISFLVPVRLEKSSTGLPGRIWTIIWTILSLFQLLSLSFAWSSILTNKQFIHNYFFCISPILFYQYTNLSTFWWVSQSFQPCMIFLMCTVVLARYDHQKAANNPI